MLNDEQLKFAIEDARTRQSALLELIYSSERQALSLLSLYVTLGLASASGAAAAFSQAVQVPLEVGIALAAALVILTSGAGFCFQALKTSKLGLPGRGPEFWKWARGNEGVSFADAAESYLSDLEAVQSQDRQLNEQIAKALTRAKICGISAPVATWAAGVAAVFVLRPFAL